MKMRNAICLVVVFTMLITTFVGCNKNEEVKESLEETTTAEVSTVANTEVKKEAKPVSISFAHWRQEDKEAYAKIYAKAKEVYPDITIEEEILPPGDYMNVLDTRMAAASAPDIFGINGVQANAGKYHEAGYLEDLSDVPNILNIKEDITKITTDDNGFMYAIVWNSLNFGMYYNKDLFNQVGAQVPKTWDEFVGVCEKLEDAGIDSIALGGKDAHVNYWLFELIAMSDMWTKDPGMFERVDEGKAKFSELDAYRGTLDKFSLLAEKGYLRPEYLGLTYNDSVTLFAQGKAAMLPGGSFTAPTIRKANESMNIGAFNIPGETGETMAWLLLGMSYGINKGSEDIKKAAAKQFLDIMCEKDVSVEFSEETALFTTVKGVELKYTDTAINDFSAMMSGKVFVRPVLDRTVVDPTWYQELTSQLQGVVAGEFSSNDVLKALDMKILER
jgi:raffinose/stachyose/melibiose transport system substrate-binding protein